MREGLARSLANQARLAQRMNRPGEAVPQLEEAYRIAADHGLNALARQIKAILDSVRLQAR
jgi:hypothetical protein